MYVASAVAEHIQQSLYLMSESHGGASKGFWHGLRSIHDCPFS